MINNDRPLASKYVLYSAAALLLGSMALNEAGASSTYVNSNGGAFAQRYGDWWNFHRARGSNVGSSTESGPHCAACHTTEAPGTTGGARNAFGQAVLTNGGSGSVAAIDAAAAQSYDSDGVSTVDELSNSAIVSGLLDFTFPTLTDAVRVTATSLNNAVQSVEAGTSGTTKVADIGLVFNLGSDASVASLTLGGADASLFEIFGSELRLRAGQSLTAGQTLRVFVSADSLTTAAVEAVQSNLLNITVAAADVAPTAVNLTQMVSTVPDTQSAQIDIASVAVTDDGRSSVALSLTGPDAAKFGLSTVTGTSATVFLKAGQSLTAGTPLSVAVIATDAVGSKTSTALTLSITATNQPPTAV
ncbi:hypothetical protein ACWPM1_12100, partial [Tsuneonella sp. HG249]